MSTSISACVGAMRFILLFVLQTGSAQAFVIDDGSSLPPSGATQIVDTGLPGSSFCCLSLNSLRLGAQFTIDQSYRITDMEGFLTTTGAGTGHVAIYTDGAEPIGFGSQSVPGVEIFNALFDSPLGTGFVGAHGLTNVLTTGTYWVVFDVRAGDTLQGGMWYGFFSDPLAAEVLKGNGASAWSRSDALNLGIKIAGISVNSVPLPVPVAMLGAGFALLCLPQFRRKPLRR